MAVISGLFSIESFLRIIEQFMVDISYVLAAKFYIQMAAAGVYVGCVKFTTIVIEGTLPHHCADCSFQIHSLSPAQAGPVLLLLPRVTQKHF